MSVVIPAKNSGGTILATVEALFEQDHEGLIEVIVVGDVGDSALAALQEIDDPRLLLLSHPPTPGRDCNVKRRFGLACTSGDYLALVDSDVVLPPHWLRTASQLLAGKTIDCVAGGMAAIEDSFWGRFVDKNRISAKTPRIPAPYVVDATNFGRGRAKPPITANVMFTREFYESTPLDPGWNRGYEDYEWFWRAVSGGSEILVTDDLTARHRHRLRLADLVREYRRSSRGCAYFVARHPESPLARKRLLQAIALPLGALGAMAAALVLALLGLWFVPVAAAALLLGASAAREYVHTRGIRESFLYPLIGLLLGAVFLAHLTVGLVSLAFRRGGEELTGASSLVAAAGSAADEAAAEFT